MGSTFFSEQLGLSGNLPNEVKSFISRLLHVNPHPIRTHTHARTHTYTYRPLTVPPCSLLHNGSHFSCRYPFSLPRSQVGPACHVSTIDSSRFQTQHIQGRMLTLVGASCVCVGGGAAWEHQFQKFPIIIRAKSILFEAAEHNGTKNIRGQRGQTIEVRRSSPRGPAQEVQPRGGSAEPSQVRLSQGVQPKQVTRGVEGGGGGGYPPLTHFSDHRNTISGSGPEMKVRAPLPVSPGATDAAAVRIWVTRHSRPETEKAKIRTGPTQPPTANTHVNSGMTGKGKKNKHASLCNTSHNILPN